MGKFIVGYDDKGKAQYQYVYGGTYDEAESKMLIGQEVASRYLSGRYITVKKVYAEWLNAVPRPLSSGQRKKQKYSIK